MKFVVTPRTARHALAAAALALAATASSAVTLVGLTSANLVSIIDSTNVAAATSVTITGLASSSDRLIGIDLRPFDNKIYGVSLSNNIYTLNPTTGAATFVAALNTTIVSPTVAYGIDFNPVADFPGATAVSLRLVSSAGSNYAINASTGAVTVATGVASGFTSVAYTNSTPLPTSAPASTSLYYIDSAADTLSVATTGFNNPTITLVGSLGIDVLKAGGFDILSNGQAFAALLTDDGSADSSIYAINLATGAATLAGNFTGTLTGLTAMPVPEASTWAMMAMGLLSVGVFMRKRRAA